MKNPISLLLAALLALTACTVHAQPFPARPVRIILTAPPGTTPDITARLLATKLSEVWRQPVVVDNRVGAGGTIGADAAAKSPADGYTVLYAPNPVFTMAPHMYQKLPYAITDFQPVTMVARLGFILLANKEFPASNLKEAIDYVRANPGTVSYGSYGVGSGPHLSMALLEREQQLRLVHVPYKAGAAQDLVGGQVQLLFEPYGGTALEFAKTGKVKVLGVSMKSRSPDWPNVPAISEVVPGYESPGWLGWFLPARTPPEITQKYQEAIATVMAMPEIQAQFRKLSVEPVNTGPVVLAETIRQETAYWSSLIKRLGIRLD